MTEAERRFRITALALIAVSLLAITVLVVAIDYKGRQSLANSARAGCGRAVTIRVALATASWQQAQANAAEAALFNLAANGRARRLVAPLVATRTLEARSQTVLARLDAAQIEPAAAGALPRPLRRLATFSYAAAFPAASLLP